jgi:hypothetical protein
MNYTQSLSVRSEDLLRHLHDLRTGTYEGTKSRNAKEELYRRGVQWLTPVAIAVLEEANALFLKNTGSTQVIGPERDSMNGLVTRFELSWPEQRSAHVAHGLSKALEPVCIIVDFSQNFLHPHLAGSTAGFWPFQVINESDAERQRGILVAIVEMELHRCIFETDWRIFPVSPTPPQDAPGF